MRSPFSFSNGMVGPGEAEHSSRAQSHRRAVAWPDSETFFRFRTKLMCELASTPAIRDRPAGSRSLVLYSA